MRAGRANQISSCKPKTINLKKIKYSEELRGTAKSGGDSLSFLTPLKTYCLCPETLSLCLVVALILNDFYFTLLASSSLERKRQFETLSLSFFLMRTEVSTLHII